MTEIYEPQEDSLMLSSQVRKYARGIVLDMGTGTGIQSLTALQCKQVKRVIGADISMEAVAYCNKNIKNKNAKFVISNLFEYFYKRNLQKRSSFHYKFDTVIFNPPYLPSELKLRDLTTEGGKKGYETIGMFLSGVSSFLKPDGIILMLFSSFTKKDIVDKLITDNLLEYELLDKRHIFFEDINVYLIKKSEILKNAELLGISCIKFYARGRHGIIFRGELNGRMCILKIKNPVSNALDIIIKEGRWLEILNRYKIGPRLFFRNDDFIVCEFIEGEYLPDFLKSSNSACIKRVIRKLLSQLYKMDILGISKEEMHRPIKHIIIRKDMPVMIDFERSRFTKKPKNVTQFCDFLIKCRGLLHGKGIYINKEEIIEMCQMYRKSFDKDSYKKIVRYICHPEKYYV